MMGEVRNCKRCGLRLGDGSGDYCPSCELSYSLVAVPRRWVRPWAWRLFKSCTCRPFPLWRIGRWILTIPVTEAPHA